jgi:ArsR family transcriptional regulator, arsenate/arsenite/antimonite-responsive transcriptional repressor
VSDQPPAAQRDTDIVALFRRTQPLLTALGDESRQLIFTVLLEAAGALSVSEIAERTPLSQPAVSHHLKILRTAGLLDLERNGARRLYSVTSSEIALFAPLTELIVAVDACREPSRPEAAQREARPASPPETH